MECAEDERSESEGRFGEAEPEGCASIRVREVREVFKTTEYTEYTEFLRSARPRKLARRQIAVAIDACSSRSVRCVASPQRCGKLQPSVVPPCQTRNGSSSRHEMTRNVENGELGRGMRVWSKCKENFYNLTKILYCYSCQNYNIFVIQLTSCRREN